MTNELQRVPQFSIIQVEGGDPGRCTGLFDSVLKLEDSTGGFLVSQEKFCIEGRFSAFDAQTRQAAFVPIDVTQMGMIVVGQKYAYLDSYWGDIVALVLDTTKEWRQVLFQPQDANEHSTEGTIILGKSGQLPSFKVDGEPRLVTGGWDHEHCSICWEEISPEAQACGYMSKNADWVCVKCYTNFVQPKEVGFLTEEMIAQIRGN
jgi:hypothetical protein